MDNQQAGYDRPNDYPIMGVGSSDPKRVATFIRLMI